MPTFILIMADQAHTLALHLTMQAPVSKMAEQAAGSGVVTTLLAEVLSIRTPGAYHIGNGIAQAKDGFVRFSLLK